MYAAMENKIGIIERLLELGCDLGASNREGTKDLDMIHTTHFFLPKSPPPYSKKEKDNTLQSVVKKYLVECFRLQLSSHGMYVLKRGHSEIAIEPRSIGSRRNQRRTPPKF